MRMLVMMSKKSKVAKVARMTFVEFRRIFGRRKMMMQTKLPQRPIWKTMTSSELFLKSTNPCHHHKCSFPQKIIYPRPFRGENIYTEGYPNY